MQIWRNSKTLSPWRDRFHAELYKKLLKAIGPLGAFREDVKKTSIHLVRGSAFAGVHPRKQHLLLTINVGQVGNLRPIGKLPDRELITVQRR